MSLPASRAACPTGRRRRPQLIDEFRPKLEEWIDRSGGKLRADVAHEKLLALGFTGSERTTRRAVRQAKAAFKAGRVRVHRPWVTEPGMWLQYDFGDGPVIDGKKTVLFCAWLAWSRFRVVLALRDRTAPSVFAALDVTLRRLGGAPTYVLTDNEKTVTVEHVAGMAVRNPQTVAFARHYGLTVHTCEPADPASKGGSESTVKLAKADLVPTDTNLLGAYDSFAELERACEVFCEQVNARVHRMTRRAPADMLAQERARLHPLPAAPHTVALGVTRTVAATTPMVTFDGGQYSVPHTLLGQAVWVRVHGQGPDERVVIVHVGPAGPVEVARHPRAQPGSPRLDDAHFPPAPAGALGRAAQGQERRGGRVPRPRRRRPALADRGRRGRQPTDAGQDGRRGRAGQARRPRRGRLGARARRGPRPVRRGRPRLDPGPPRRTARDAPDRSASAGEDRSLTQGTAGWAALGTSTARTRATPA